MQQAGHFRQTYLALVALVWEALEHVDRSLTDARGAWATPATEGRLQWVRLELLQLRESAMRCAAAHRLSLREHQQVSALVSRLLDWLDFDAGTPVEIVRLRLGVAQNWLLDEAREDGVPLHRSIAPSQLQNAQ